MATVQQAPIAPAEPPAVDASAVDASANANADTVIPSAPSTATSLYVGDLHPSVTEQLLQEKFSAAGPVTNVRVCRDAITRHSLGYGYVNFQQNCDAKTALSTMNFDALAGKPMRLMWSQRDPTVRRSGAANIFIKNLEKSIDTKSIYDTFTMFGPILSCKVATDEEGVSKGYGFIHFESEESANKAIEKVNGMELESRVVYVTKFIPKSARIGEKSEAAAKFTNCYVKNFGEELSDASLMKLFEPYGKVKSCVVMKRKDEEGNEQSRGFGFVDFEKHEDAVRAVDELNGHVLPGGAERKLTVCRFQRKAERQAMLKEIYEKKKLERILRYQGVNLYVKNLDDCFSDEAFLRKTFEGFGKTSSAKIMRDEAGRPKGFGFVCFERPEDATKAVLAMNNKMFGNKPLYVALAQRKEERKKKLAQQYQLRVETIRREQQQRVAAATTIYANSGGSYYLPSMVPLGRNFVPPSLSGGAQPRYGQWGGVGGFNPSMSASVGMDVGVGYPLQRDGPYGTNRSGYRGGRY